jgi:MarR family transcriptional regulator, 2-MHQ and catechol-resistance regulon repressor
MSKTVVLEAPRLSSDAVALQAAIAELVRVYQFRDRDSICCYDVSVTQCHALETLVEHGSMRQGALAERLFLDKSTTSRVVGALLKKGYVEQADDPADGRAVVLRATRSGRNLCTRIGAGLVAQQEQLLGDLAPEVRAGVITVLRRLAQAADARFRSGGRTAPGCCGTANTCA